MFKKLREKFSGWLKKKPQEEVAAEPEKKEEKKVAIKKSEKKVEKSKEKVEKKKKREKKEGVVLGKKDKEKKPAAIEKDEEKKEAEEIVEEIESIDERVEEKLKERAEEISEEVHLEPSFDEQLRGAVAGEDSEEIKKKIEEEKKEVEEEPAEEQGGFFFKLKKKLSTSILKQDEFDELFEDLEMTLLENNVALGVVDKIREELGKDVVGISVKKKEVEETILNSLREAIDLVLVEGEDIVEKLKRKEGEPYVILFFGINGSGKTTSIAKFAWKLKQEGIDCVLAAGDTFRAASIEQIEEHGRRVGVDVVKGEYGKDPASVAFDAISYAKKNKKKVVLIDTAGRMYTKANLMKEMEKIVRVTNADLKIFVGEAITGNDATEQAKMFNETAGIDGIILTKADVDEKAGAILSVSHVTGKPVLFLGVGQEYKDLERFEKKRVLKGLGLLE